VPGQAGARQVWNETAGLYETVEAPDPDDTLNVWVDLLANVDVGTNTYGETRVLHVQNAHAAPDTNVFEDEQNPTGSDTDFFRFSVAGSTSNWPGSEGTGLARLYWDFGLWKTQWLTNYYDPLSPSGRIIRLHRFANHVPETRTLTVAFELMRPDEDPGDTVNVTQRQVQVVKPTPLGVQILGPDLIMQNGWYTWEMATTGGTTPYGPHRWEYKRHGTTTWTIVGNQPTYTRYVRTSDPWFWLQATVWDAVSDSVKRRVAVETWFGGGAAPLTGPVGVRLPDGTCSPRPAVGDPGRQAWLQMIMETVKQIEYCSAGTETP